VSPLAISTLIILDADSPQRVFLIHYWVLQNLFQTSWSLV